MKIEDHHASPDWGRPVAASDQRWNQYEKLSSEGFRAAFEYAAEQLLLKPFGWRHVDGIDQARSTLNAPARQLSTFEQCLKG